MTINSSMRYLTGVFTKQYDMYSHILAHRTEQGHATLLCSFFLASSSAFHWVNAAMPSSDS